MPNGVIHNQIDYILATRLFKSSRTVPGVNINSIHDLVMVTLKLKLKKTLRNHGPRLEVNLEKLKDPQISDLFDATIGGFQLV